MNPSQPSASPRAPAEAAIGQVRRKLVRIAVPGVRQANPIPRQRHQPDTHKHAAAVDVLRRSDWQHWIPWSPVPRNSVHAGRHPDRRLVRRPVIQGREHQVRGRITRIARLAIGVNVGLLRGGGRGRQYVLWQRPAAEVGGFGPRDGATPPRPPPPVPDVLLP